MEANKIETKFDEVRKTTSEPRQMLNMYLAADVCKEWTEDFRDLGNGETISIHRKELLFKKGILLTPEICAQIQFYQGTGDISTVEVSNQQRMAELKSYGGLNPWSVSIQFAKQKHRILLYAVSAQMAIDVVKDYVELNYDEPFMINTVKTFTNCIILPDIEREENPDAEAPEELKFYQIDVCVRTDNGTYDQSFVLRETDVDNSMIRINKFLFEQAQKRAAERGQDMGNIETAIERAIVITCTATIEREFSLAYIHAESKV